MQVIQVGNIGKEVPVEVGVIRAQPVNYFYHFLGLCVAKLSTGAPGRRPDVLTISAPLSPQKKTPQSRDNPGMLMGE